MTAFIIKETDENYAGKQPIPPELFAEGEPTADVWASGVFERADNLKTGIWVGQPGKINVPAYPSDEVFTVISGEVALINSDGTSVKVGPGESCLIHKGWAGVWHTISETRKCYVVFNG